MHVIIVGCGRVGASAAASLNRAGHSVVVIDRNANAFRLLPRTFAGRKLQGMSYDRAVLEEADIERADGLVAVTSGDNTNIIVARVAKEIYRVPDVVARIYDPQRADIYRRYGVTTFAPTAWSSGKIIEFLTSGYLEREISFGNGEVQLMSAWAPPHLVGKPITDLRIPGEIRVALIVRKGRGLIPVSGTVIEEEDQVHVVVHQSAVEKFQKMMGWTS
jgi:trk system potassium uptake protein TrkA